MEKKIMHSTVIVLLLLTNFASGQDNRIITSQGIFRTDCFSDTNDGLCESSLIAVGNTLYACGMTTFVGLGFTVNRIGVIDGQILISRGDSHIYGLRENGRLYPVKKALIPQSGNIVDKNNNVYFNAGGTTYVGLNETGEEVVIETLGFNIKSFNQLALDTKSNTLFILAVKANHLISLPKDRAPRERGLYAVNTNPLKIEEYKRIQALLLEGFDNITAFAIEPESQNILLGVDTTHGNKFIRLIKLQKNPCPRRSPLRYFLGNQLIEYSKNLEEMCRDAYNIVNRGGGPTQKEFSIVYNNLANEKLELNRKLMSLPNCSSNDNRVRPSNVPETQTSAPKKQMTTLETPSIEIRKPADDAKSTCPPPSRKELENKNLTIELANVTERFNRLVRKLIALETKMNLNQDLLKEEETTTTVEPAYREAQKCIEVYELDGLTNRISKLEEAKQQLRTQLIEFTDKFKEIIKYRDVERKSG